VRTNKGAFCERWRVEEGELRLPQALVNHAPLRLTSMKGARRLIESGRCSVNGRIRTFASTDVRRGDWIEVAPGGPTGPKARCSILYEDDTLLVINKPAGVPVEQGAMDRAVGQRTILVHRLDKETSGLLLLAKDQSTATELERMFRERTIQKEYLAIVDGGLQRPSGVITWPLKMKRRLFHEIYWGVDPAGKEAVTEFTRLLVGKGATCVLLKPKTGRTHQLRVHMAHLGHPIVGDYQYADRFQCSVRPERCLLHAWRLTFVHPVDGQMRTWEAPLPQDMHDAITQLFGKEGLVTLCAR
jgi:RluA family pseudouridine synthase